MRQLLTSASSEPRVRVGGKEAEPTPHKEAEQALTSSPSTGAVFVLPAPRAKEDDAWGRCGPRKMVAGPACSGAPAARAVKGLPNTCSLSPARYRHSRPARLPAAHRRFKISTDGVFAPANYMVRYNTSGGVRWRLPLAGEGLICLGR